MKGKKPEIIAPKKYDLTPEIADSARHTESRVWVKSLDITYDGITAVRTEAGLTFDEIHKGQISQIKKSAREVFRQS